MKKKLFFLVLFFKLMRWNLAWFIRTCQNWGQIYPNHVVLFVQRYYSTIASQKSVLRSFRHFVAKYYPEISQEWTALCKLPRYEHKKQKYIDKQRLLLKAESPPTCDVEFYLRTMCELLSSGTAACVAAGLLMATGRRTIEIAQCGSLRETRKVHSIHSAFWLQFSGPAKKRKNVNKGPTNGANKNRYPSQQKEQPLRWDIPVLARADQVLACFQFLRSLPEGKKGVKTKFWQTDVKAVLRERFKQRFPELVPKTCRAVYARISYLVFNPVKAVNLWTMHILGHVKPETSMNYLNIHVCNVRNPCETYNLDLPEVRLGQAPNVCLDP